MLGMSMQVENVSVERVREKMKMLRMAVPRTEPSFRQRMQMEKKSQTMMPEGNDN
jgi:hypothetical protein